MPKFVKSSLVDQIFDYLQSEILKGTWAPGEKLPSETELAASLDVSRMSLRSAIQRCCAMGLTETRVGEGTFVRDFNLRSYFTELYRLKLLGRNPNEINDMRAILQLGSVRLAMTDSISQEKIGKLEELFHQMEAAADRRDLPKFHELDSDFHRLICSLGNNELLFLIYDALAELTEDVMHHNVEKSVAAFQGFSRIMEHHRELVESIKAYDMDRFTTAIMGSRERSSSYYPNL